MTPLEGVMMGSRSGDLDPAIPLFLVNRLGVSPEEVDRLLNKDSGVKGICGLTDFRDIDAKAAEGDEPCRLALEMFAYRVARYIGAYAMAMDGVDAIVFTAGIGENNWTMRERILEQAGHLGVQLDKDKNAANEAVVSTPDSQAQVFVIPTNEEFVIARDTARLVMEHTGAEA
jgi:acetate kinase